MVGAKNLFYDPSRLLHLTSIIDNQISFQDKTETNIDELFTARYNLFKNVYLHKTAVAIQLMILDIFNDADCIWNFR